MTAFGPQLPGFEDLWRIQARTADAQAIAGDAEYRQAVADRQATEIAFNRAQEREAPGGGWAAVDGWMHPYYAARTGPGPDHQANLDQLAADAAEAADIHGPASPEHDAAMDAFAEVEEEEEEEADQQICPALPGFEELWAAQERAAELTETGTDAEYATAIAERQHTEAAFLQNLDRQLDAALAEPDASAEQAFYGSHAENGHAARWGPDGPECDSCAEQYRPPAQAEREAEAG
jgi:hypothetical protein